MESSGVCLGKVIQLSLIQVNPCGMNKNLSKEIKSLLEAEETQNFLSVAREFISLIENKEIIAEKEFCIQIHKTLLNLYNAGFAMKEVELIYSSDKSEFKIPQDEMKEHTRDLFSFFSKHFSYWKIFDPACEEKAKPIQCWVGDDIIDIYTDLKEELYKIYEIGTDESIEDGLWELKFGFTTHWGNHCIDAIRALHYIYYDGKPTI